MRKNIERDRVSSDEEIDEDEDEEEEENRKG